MFEDLDFDYDQYGGLDGFDPTSGYTLYDHLDPSTMVGAPPSDGPNGNVLSKAELDGTNVFGANSVPGAYEVDGALAQLWRNFQGATGNKGLNDWLRYALAGATALNAFKTPNSNAATVGQPRTRPGLSAFQMATSPGGLNFTVNGRGANVAFAGGGEVGALGRCCSAMAEGGPFVGYVTGPGGGQDDLIDARLSPGEYVFDADTVAALGDGNNEEGARRLDAMREQIRGHKREAPPTEIPPQAAAPEEYLNAAMQGGV